MTFSSFLSLIFIGLLIVVLVIVLFQSFIGIFNYIFSEDNRIKIDFKND